jgi:uncharacterized protein YndB with AHSA1/START domain/DNA-binding transcriptional ArsR family regulator
MSYMKADDASGVLRALADPSRRRLLELLRERPGRTASDLAEEFPFSRIALLKHLGALDRAGLIVRRRIGKRVELHPSAAVSKQEVAAWLRDCGPLWVARLRSFKATLEREGSMAGPRHAYVIYIRTTPERLWKAITEPEQTRKFFYGTDVRSTFRPNAPIEYTLRDEAGNEVIPVVGKVLVCEPPRRLVHTFQFPNRPDAATRVSYQIDPEGPDTVRLTLVHDEFDGETPTFQEVGGGWPRVLSSLKTLLETGTPLSSRRSTTR